MRRILAAGLLGSALALSACTAADPSPAPTPKSEPTTQSPTQSPKLADAELFPIDNNQVYLEIPKDWSFDTPSCKTDCSEWDQIEFYDGEKNHVLTLLPNTATSTDGDMNLYDRKVLMRTEQPDLKVPGLDYIPRSVIAEYWRAENQETSKKATGLSIAMVDDEILEKSGKEPALYYFKMNDENWPMFFVDSSYLYKRIGSNPREQAAADFVASDEYALIEKIMLTVRTAGG
ncbi:hypothetical protein AUR04nite_03810 [Glutamicibacter uratoxydans]|uniref:Lipoprotein n=1 Tax=Glutamicibacter uratoxydans TaxID=43667 RepID=A0A4Y4DHX6_GLUUR|nr:hypothetical protein [Glutamicibacter uratoxydans]GED04849.1 hypothetical protein AUR04nite_03810 [Glutamicibacter uratoxydans]